HLIRGDVMEAEGRFRLRLKSVPIAPCSFQQRVGTDDIGLNKVCRSVDGAVHMGLGRQVHHRRRLELGKHPIQCQRIADVHPIEAVTWRFNNRINGIQVTRIGQFIETGDLMDGIANKMAYYSRTNETGATSNENATIHILILVINRIPALKKIFVLFQNLLPSESRMKTLTAGSFHPVYGIVIFQKTLEQLRACRLGQKISRIRTCDPAIKMVVMGNHGATGTHSLYKRGIGTAHTMTMQVEAAVQSQCLYHSCL